MKLTIGEHAGFCFGVRRAVLKAFECAEKQLPCVTLGPLIHNPQEVERLRRAGIRSVETLDEVKPGETVMPDAQAAEQAELPQKALVVAQTTIRRDRFDSVLQVLRRRVPDLTERITICAATSQRQQEAEKLSGEADVMVVVGGRNSSNTQKLLETCRLRCERSVLVETPEDVPPDLAEADDRVALTAGASTPQWLLEQVRARIEENAKTR